MYIDVNVRPTNDGRFTAHCMRTGAKTFTVVGHSRLAALDALAMLLESELDKARAAFVMAKASFHEEAGKAQTQGQQPQALFDKEGN